MVLYALLKKNGPGEYELHGALGDRALAQAWDEKEENVVWELEASVGIFGAKLTVKRWLE